MDIFRVLARGASLKKVKDVNADYALSKPLVNLNSIRKDGDLEKQIKKETDFFRTRKKVVLKEEENFGDSSSKEGKGQEINFNVDDDQSISQLQPKITTQEEANFLRKSYKCKVTGDDVPLPIGSFEDLISRFQLDKRLLENLIEFGFTEPTPIQSEAIPISLYDRDLIACAPTGSGKSLAFLIPLMQQLSHNKKNYGIRGLIISPTKELAQQLFNELNKLNKRKNLKIGILSKHLATKIKNQIIQSSKFDILISTPLRLIDVVKIGSLDLTRVERLIFDEADKLFDQGFLEQTDDILSQCTNSKLVKSMFSATIPSGVEETANSIMNSPVRVIIGHKEAANSQIEQKLVYCGNEEGKLIAIRQMIQNGEFKPPIIIFLQSITRAKALFHELLYDKLNVDVIHAERTQTQREKVIENFKLGNVWVLICTDVLARGIDFKGVNMVINYDVPQSAQAYVHRIGRTGRAGKSGKSVTFFTKEDSIAIKPVINVMKQSGCNDGFGNWMENLGKITKKEKNLIKGKPVSRKEISTVPKIVKEKKRKHREMIQSSKKRKEENK